MAHRLSRCEPLARRARAPRAYLPRRALLRSRAAHRGLRAVSALSPSAAAQPRPTLAGVLASPKLLAIMLLAAASGYPNQITETAFQAWLKDSGATNTTIGLLSYVSLPYLLKFIWAPLVDRYPLPLLGRRRGWILAMQIALAGAIALFALQNPAQSLTAITVCAVAIVFFSATQDIAIDAYRTDVSLPS